MFNRHILGFLLLIFFHSSCTIPCHALPIQVSMVARVSVPQNNRSVGWVSNSMHPMLNFDGHLSISFPPPQPPPPPDIETVTTSSAEDQGDANNLHCFRGLGNAFKGVNLLLHFVLPSGIYVDLNELQNRHRFKDKGFAKAIVLYSNQSATSGYPERYENDLNIEPTLLSIEFEDLNISSSFASDVDVDLPIQFTFPLHVRYRSAALPHQARITTLALPLPTEALLLSSWNQNLIQDSSGGSNLHYNGHDEKVEKRSVVVTTTNSSRSSSRSSSSSSLPVSYRNSTCLQVLGEESWTSRVCTTLPIEYIRADGASNPSLTITMPVGAISDIPFVLMGNIALYTCSTLFIFSLLFYP